MNADRLLKAMLASGIVIFLGAVGAALIFIYAYVALQAGTWAFYALTLVAFIMFTRYFYKNDVFWKDDDETTRV